MQAGAKPQLSASWWLKNKAKTLLGTDLEKYLAAYEKPFTEWKKKLDETDLLKKASEGLKKLPDGVKATIGKCNASLHKETIECLKKFDALIKLQQKNINAELQRRDQIEKFTLEQFLNGPFKDRFNEFGKKRFNEENLAYLNTMKGKKGGRAEFDKFIAVGSENELNISGSLRKDFFAPGTKDQKTPRADLDKAPWDKVYSEVVAMATLNLLAQFKTVLTEEDTFKPLLG
jgi:hypothetical protein